MIGIDVSKWNSPSGVPWVGCDFGAVRVSFGRTLDPLAAEHLRRARDAGVRRLLAYHFVNMSASGEEQAAAFLGYVHGLEDELGVRLGLAGDLEDLLAPAPPWPRGGYSVTANAFWTWLAEHVPRRPVGVYGAPSFLDELALSPIVRASPLWLAHHTQRPVPTLPKAWPRWAIWQHGIGGGIDRNRCRLTPEQWDALWCPPDAHAELGGVVAGVRAAAGHGASVQAFEDRDEGPRIEPT